MKQKFNIAIIGARGYSGLELVKLLAKHPNVGTLYCCTRDTEWNILDDVYIDPSAGADVKTILLDEVLNSDLGIDTVFLATPIETSIEMVKMLKGRDYLIIDLSGAFRFDTNGSESIYGLVPWTAVSDLKKFKLISNPGCYATSVLMALIPVVKANLIDADNIVIDSKSGTSGAGRKAAENLLYTEVADSCLPYRVGKHQHLPEICKYVSEFAGTSIDPFFTTHLLPIKRGIISGIYSRINKAHSSLSDEQILKLVDDAFAKAYSGYKLVKSGRIGASKSEAKDRMLVSMNHVVGSSRTHIAYTVINKKLYLYSVIDNLLKGASGQAVENWNLIKGFAPDTALNNTGGSL